MGNECYVCKGTCKCPKGPVFKDHYLNEFAVGVTLKEYNALKALAEITIKLDEFYKKDYPGTPHELYKQQDEAIQAYKELPK